MGRLLRSWAVRGLPILLAVAALPGAAGAAEEADYATFEALVTDSQGIQTEVSGFGFWTGVNVLEARRGDAIVEIPFRKIAVLEVGEYLPEKGVHPCTVTVRSGKRFPVVVERIDAQRYLGGQTEIGSYRIRLAQIRRLEIHGPSRGGLE